MASISFHALIPSSEYSIKALLTISKKAMPLSFHRPNGKERVRNIETVHFFINAGADEQIRGDLPEADLAEDGLVPGGPAQRAHRQHMIDIVALFDKLIRHIFVREILILVAAVEVLRVLRVKIEQDPACFQDAVPLRVRADGVGQRPGEIS